jgi:hypothetical protein
MRHEATRGRQISVWLLTILALLFATRSIAPGVHHRDHLQVVDELPAKRARAAPPRFEPPEVKSLVKRKPKKDGGRAKPKAAKRDSLQDPVRSAVHVQLTALGETRTEDIAVRMRGCCLALPLHFAVPYDISLANMYNIDI